MSQELELLVIHCTATPEGRKVSKAEITLWHTGSKKDGYRGWSREGYSDMVHIDGTLENIIDWNQNDIVDNFEISNGASGFNLKARHIVYVGGCSSSKPAFSKYYPSKDTRTFEQMQTLLTYVKFMILRHPNIRVVGHNELSAKECPSFNVGDWLRSECINEKNIGLKK